MNLHSWGQNWEGQILPGAALQVEHGGVEASCLPSLLVSDPEWHCHPSRGDLSCPWGASSGSAMGASTPARTVFYGHWFIQHSLAAPQCQVLHHGLALDVLGRSPHYGKEGYVEHRFWCGLVSAVLTRSVQDSSDRHWTCQVSGNSCPHPWRWGCRPCLARRVEDLKRSHTAVGGRTGI